MPVPDIREEIAQAEERLSTLLREVRADTYATRALLTGNGEPEKGLLFRFGHVERNVKFLQKCVAAFALSVCSALGAYAVTKYVSTGVPTNVTSTQNH